MWVVLFFLSSSIKNYLDIYNQSKFLKTTHQNTSEMHPKVGELGQGGGCSQPRCGSSSVGPGVVAGTPTPTATATPLAEDTKLKFCLATRAAVEGPTARLQSDFWKEVSMTRQRESKGRKADRELKEYIPHHPPKMSAYGHLVLLHSLWDSPYWARTQVLRIHLPQLLPPTLFFFNASFKKKKAHSQL